MMGESTMNTAIFRKPSASSECQPAFATSAPAIPPIRACDEDVGSPKYQVMMSHTMAPISPANTTPKVNTSGFTTSFAMVEATLVLNTRNATKLKTAAQTTAKLGERTRVDTTVAIEFAASWKPLKKSNDRATRMTRTRPVVTTV